MSSTIARRIAIGVILAAVVAVWATTRMHSTAHYSDTPGQGAALERMVLPPPDDSRGGNIPLPDPGSGSPAVHYPAQYVAVDQPPAAPPAVPATRNPDTTPQDPQVVHPTPTGSPVHDQMPGTPGFDAGIIALPLCDAACVQRVLAGLGIPPITTPPIEPPIEPPVAPPVLTP